MKIATRKQSARHSSDLDEPGSTRTQGTTRGTYGPRWRVLQSSMAECYGKERDNVLIPANLLGPIGVKKDDPVIQICLEEPSIQVGSGVCDIKVHHLPQK